MTTHHLSLPLLYPTLPYPTKLYSTLPYPTPPNSTLPYPTHLHPTPPYPTLLYLLTLPLRVKKPAITLLHMQLSWHVLTLPTLSR